MKIVKEEIGDVLAMLHESNLACEIQLVSEESIGQFNTTTKMPKKFWRFVDCDN